MGVVVLLVVRLLIILLVAVVLVAGVVAGRVVVVVCFSRFKEEVDEKIRGLDDCVCRCSRFKLLPFCCVCCCCCLLRMEDEMLPRTRSVRARIRLGSRMLLLLAILGGAEEEGGGGGRRELFDLDALLFLRPERGAVCDDVRSKKMGEWA